MALINTDNLTTALECTKSYVDSEISRLNHNLASDIDAQKEYIDSEIDVQKEYTDLKFDSIKILSASDIKKLFPIQNIGEIKYTSINNDVVYPSSFDYEQFGAFFEYSRNENGIGTIKFDDDVLNIGSSTIENGTGVFSNTALTSIQLPKTVTSIGESAFENCTHLTTYNIPSNTTYIGKNAFKGTNATVIVIPESVKTIGAGAFAGNSDTKSLKEVHCNLLTPPDVIMDNEIWGAFDKHNEDGFIIIVPAESVEVYKTTKGWSEYADNIISVQNNQIIYTTKNSNILNPYDSSDFGANIMSNTYENGYGVIEFDGDVTKIGYRAFYGCSNLTSVTIPNSVTSIGRYTFYECYDLINITIPDNVTSIGEWTFAYCTSLTSVTIPDSVTEIGSSAFYNCTGLTAFYGKFATEDNLCLIVNDTLEAFAIGSGVTEYIIPDSVTKIGYGAFRGCKSLTSVTIPDSVAEIGSNAFYGCSSLTNVTIGNSVTSIGDNVFYFCTNLIAFYGKFVSDDGRCLIVDGVLKAFAPSGLTEYTIPDSVNSIGWNAFSGFSNLTSITIPDSVTSIDYRAFYGCRGLTSVYCQPVTPPTLSSGVFDNNSSNRIIYVPTESVEAYKTATGWSTYAKSIQGYDFSINN